MAYGNSKYKDKASVTIRLDAASGEITLSEDPIYIKQRGKIDWRCDDGDWSVTVDDPDDPFDEGKVVNGKKGQKKTVKVKKDANQGQPDGRDYKYTVEVTAGGKPVRKDPDVVVGPEDPPPNGDGG